MRRIKLAVNWQAFEALIKHYFLYDRHCRQSILGFMGLSSFSLVMLVLIFWGISGKMPALFLLVLFTGFLFGVSVSVPLVLAYVIQREKAEGSFRVLRALPISPETLFFGTILAGVVASVALVLALYSIMLLALIPQGARWLPLLTYAGWGALLASFLFASFILTVALCVNSQAVLVYLLVGVSFLMSSLGLMMRLLKQKLRPLENRLEELIYFFLSFEGGVLVSMIVIILSVLISYTGSRIFSRKRSYV